jgi:hypothetical protein
MKTLDNINNDIENLKEEMFCQESGNDFYYTSPLYHKHLIRLHALEHERDILLGKQPPLKMNFDVYNNNKRILLKNIAAKEGEYFANECCDLKTEDINKLSKDALTGHIN